MSRPIRALRWREGSVLFEVLLSIALFVGAAAFTMGATRTALEAIARARRQAMAVDIARSTMAELEAGLIDLADLRDREDGVAELGSITLDADEDPLAAAGPASRWVLEATSSRTEFTGLTLVELSVREERDGLDEDDRVASYTLRQLVALREESDEAYEADEMMRDLPAPGGGRDGGSPP